MATVVVDTLVSASLDLLLGKLKDLTTKLDDPLLEKLRSTLERLQDLVNDAEVKQFTKPDVKRWLVELRGAAFEAEDLFDQINTDALRRSVEAEYSKLPNFLSSCFNFLSSCFSFSNKNINVEMQTLLERLEGYAKEGHEHHGLITGASSSVLHGTPPTSSVAVDISAICGRHKDIKKLKGFLLSKHADEDGGEIGVVSIVGMGGLGKTTLAKLLYHDPEVDKKFNLKGWAHISKDFDEVKLTKALLESITKKAPEANNLDTLQVQLQESLNGKVFLLVLDDIWDVKYGVWDRLKNIFNVGKPGSKIIITTRDEKIPQAMQNFCSVHKLDPLGSEDCWSLLAKHAFVASNDDQRSNLEGIGKEIAQKCGGLPLAAVALGGLLRTKPSTKDWKDHWNHVLKSNIWELGDAEVKPALLLSYYYLPGHLKRCFAYCAIFPKNYKLKKEMIAPLWIAEGLVLQPKSEKSWEKVAEEYFDELVSRSMIHRRSVYGKEIFEMHDLMNDLATTVSSPYCMRLDEHNEVGSLERVRHLSFNPDADNSYNKFDRLCVLKGLHTFLSLPLLQRFIPSDCISDKADKAIGDFLPAMEHLHLLSLATCNITKVPTSIGNLIYLRYLNLSTTPIVKLPSETSKLVNLQTLIVSRCRRLTELPEDMGKLVSLRNLDVSGTPLREMPVQIGKLKNLHTLSDFIVGKQCNGLKVGELGKLPHLRGNLSISELQNVIVPSEASQANLKTKKQIDKLILEWNPTAPLDSSSQIQSDVLERLQPAVNLKSLTIDGYGGTKFPKWLGDSSYGNMVYLMIKNCDNCSRLPPLGQLGKLKKLSIYGMESVKSVGAEFNGNGRGSSFKPFPSLETLSFVEMPEWEEWNLIEGTTTEFPNLRSLTLRRCPKLRGKLPISLPSLIDLELYECPLLVEPWSLVDNSNMSLSTNDCESLKFIAHKSLHTYTKLEHLKIANSCYSMTSFTLGSFPVLQTLWISDCKNLKSIVIAEDASQQQSLSSLRSIAIIDCDELESLPEPMNTLVGLHEMVIKNLPNLQSIDKDGFPINLQELGIGGSIGGDLLNTIAWECLTCLSELYINSGDIVEALMKKEAPLLPTSLLALWIYDLGDIECLDGKWLHHLTSLQELRIYKAPNLKSLPEEGFPSSLSKLKITECPLLEAILQDKQGKEWNKIAHIPSIKIDYVDIKRVSIV